MENIPKISKEEEIDFLNAIGEIEESLAKVNIQDKEDGYGKHFKIHYGYENRDMFPKDQEWTILVTGLASILFMIYWFWRIKRGMMEVNGQIRLIKFYRLMVKFC